MGFLDLFRNGPYMAWAKNLPDYDRRMFRMAKYQVVPGPSGVPMIQLDLAFQRNLPCVVNPDMSLAVLMDKSGSMSETFSSGHAYNACATILNHVARAGAGYDLYFYSSSTTHAGYIDDTQALKNAFRANRPGGGTVVTPAIQMAMNHQRKTLGLYMIVITDGEFQDKIQVEQYVTTNIIPKLTTEHPYAMRLHFIGAGEGADGAFLRKMESLGNGGGVQLVSSHHHGHISHSHDDILDELDRAFLSAGSNFLIGVPSDVKRLVNAQDAESAAEEHPIIKVGDVQARHWINGGAARFDFLPCHMTLGFEFTPAHPPTVPLELQFKMGLSFARQTFTVPMPKVSTVGPAAAKTKSWTDMFQWPGSSPEDKAQREELQRRIQEVHEAEVKRQAQDLQALAKGGIPVQARERLSELGKQADASNAIFTSNLAPDEVALLRRHGYRARGLVTGSAMYHVGTIYASAYMDCQAKELSQAYDNATELAVSRLYEELKLIGAHGVIGVRINVVRHEWSEKCIEVQIVGTAIEGPGPATLKPFLSDLSGQEWFALHRAGYEPAGLVWGHCAWFVLTTDSDEMVINPGMLGNWAGNKEMKHWSDALSQARHIAMRDVTQRMKAVGGTGMIGVKIQRRLDEVHLTGASNERLNEREHHNLLISIIGTAIRPMNEPPQPVKQTVTMLSLRDGRLKPAVLMQDAALEVED